MGGWRGEIQGETSNSFLVFVFIFALLFSFIWLYKHISPLQLVFTAVIVH